MLSIGQIKKIRRKPDAKGLSTDCCEETIKYDESKKINANQLKILET
ncbi:MAG TPA: hypothetical protein VI815_00755 [Candidatus Nanoarchaeia archaeon]|nr:hypothetical protein [Candidatus Nanoarchaeia archaeon]